MVYVYIVLYETQFSKHYNWSITRLVDPIDVKVGSHYQDSIFHLFTSNTNQRDKDTAKSRISPVQSAYTHPCTRTSFPSKCRPDVLHLFLDVQLNNQLLERCVGVFLRQVD